MKRFHGYSAALLAAPFASAADATIADCKPKPQAELAVVFLHNLPPVNLTVNGSAAASLLDTAAGRTIWPPLLLSGSASMRITNIRGGCAGSTASSSIG